MTIIDAKTIELVKLIDISIAITENIIINSANSLIIKPANETIENLKSFRMMALSEKLPRPSRGEVPEGTGLGLTRGIGEWTEDESLLDAAYAVESYYRNHM